MPPSPVESMPEFDISLVKRRSRRRRSVSMKRGERIDVRKRGSNPFWRKVEALKELIPDREAVDLDGLFRETAEYITCLQMRVKVMRIMVEVLTGSDE
ncbi:calcium-dependent protein kinase 4-like [Hibiscus syriacus]|uniref:Calcium-dependent protein kinase 4-like n=1 Tax=Hibiscus syriacus TaxID=106335 RepID=A0A6A3BS87_HIBSY|nr:calcium-dependent protein kinase 4-like [Hibiscus syriacus]